MKNKTKKYLHKQLSQKDFFTTRELKTLLAKCNPDVKESTHAWRINQLKKEKFITHVGRGIYSFNSKPEYRISISSYGLDLYQYILNIIKDSHKIVIFESTVIADLLNRPPTKHYLFVYIEKGKLEQVFYELQDYYFKVFLKPGNEIIKKMIIPIEKAIILLPLIQDTPVIQVNGSYCCSLEAILINTYLSSDKFLKPLAIPVKQIFQNTFNKYSVNTKKLLRYAGRRGKRREIEHYLQKNIKNVMI